MGPAGREGLRIAAHRGSLSSIPLSIGNAVALFLFVTGAAEMQFVPAGLKLPEQFINGVALLAFTGYCIYFLFVRKPATAYVETPGTHMQVQSGFAFTLGDPQILFFSIGSLLCLRNLGYILKTSSVPGILTLASASMAGLLIAQYLIARAGSKLSIPQLYGLNMLLLKIHGIIVLGLVLPGLINLFIALFL